MSCKEWMKMKKILAIFLTSVLLSGGVITYNNDDNIYRLDFIKDTSYNNEDTIIFYTQDKGPTI